VSLTGGGKGLPAVFLEGLPAVLLARRPYGGLEGLSAVFLARRPYGGVAEWRACPPMAGLTPNLSETYSNFYTSPTVWFWMKYSN
jgi:hypothetical protein